MIIAKVTSSRIKDRSFHIGPGLCRIGSNLDCDVVLLDEAIQPVHLVLQVIEDSIEIEIADDATARLRERSTDTVSLLHSGDRRQWKLDHVLEIEDVTIEIQGKTSVHPVIDLSLPVRRDSRYRFISVTGLLVASAVAVGGLHVSGYAASSPTYEAAQRHTPSATLPPANLDTLAVAERLEALGLKPADLTHHNGRWMAVLRVADEGALRILNAALKSLELPFEPKIYVDEWLRRAVERVLANRRSGIHVLSVDSGVVKLSASPENVKSKATLRERLYQDVPGIARIDFAKGADNDLMRTRAALAAVWAGEFPYVVLADNTTVRPGSILQQGIKLIDVGKDYIVVEIDGKMKKVNIK